MGRWISAGILLALAATTNSAPLAWTFPTGNYSWTVAVSNDGRYVIAGSDDMRAYFFRSDAPDGKPTWTHSAQGYVRHVAISSDGTSAAASDAAGNVYFFRPVSSKDPVWSFHMGSSVDAIEMNDDGRRLAAGDRRGDIYLFDTLQSGSPIWHDVIPGAVLALSLSESGALVVASAQGGIYFYDPASSQSGYAWSFLEKISFPQLKISRTADYVLAGGSDGNVYLIGALGQPVDVQSLGGSISAISLSYQTRCAIVGSTNGNVSRYLVSEKLERLDSFVAERPITAAALSSDGERISVANLDGTIFSFSHTLADSLWTFGVGAIVHSLSMSGDGLVMAAASDTGKIYLISERSLVQTRVPFAYIAYATIALTLLLIGYFLLRKRMTKVV